MDDFIFLGVFIVLFFILGFFCGYGFSDSYNESECVEFFNKNNYILDSCEIYRDKLEGIKK